MAESIQHRLSRIRPPRVQITYDVEIGNAIEKKELPFVVGVLADLSGKPAKPKPKVSDRKFVEIDRDNFNEVMSKIKPRLAFRVPNTLGGDGGDNLNVELEFENIDDFRPEQLVKQVPALKKLFEARQKLRQDIDAERARVEALAKMPPEIHAAILSVMTKVKTIHKGGRKLKKSI